MLVGERLKMEVLPCCASTNFINCFLIVTTSLLFALGCFGRHLFLFVCLFFYNFLVFVVVVLAFLWCFLFYYYAPPLWAGHHFIVSVVVITNLDSLYHLLQLGSDLAV